MTGLFPAILAYYGEPDWGVVATGYLGLVLCCMMFVAAGVFSSSLTEEPVAGGLLGVLFLMPFWVTGPAAEMVQSATARTVLRALALRTHMGAMSKGVVDTADVSWFLLGTAGFLFLTWRSLESRRWR
jgi:ABC-2 type transport system permease protein